MSTCIHAGEQSTPRIPVSSEIRNALVQRSSLERKPRALEEYKTTHGKTVLVLSVYPKLLSKKAPSKDTRLQHRPSARSSETSSPSGNIKDLHAQKTTNYTTGDH